MLTPFGNRRFILASSSPRRQQLLRDAGYDFEVVPPTVDEPDNPDAGVSPAAFAEQLSSLKATNVAETIPNALVLGADTIVALGNDIFGKPTDASNARRILSILSHNPHKVITAITLIDTDTKTRRTAHDVTRVTMRPMNEADLNAYIATGLWQGKAGAYGIQDHDDRFVQRLEGSFTNVVGLPMELLGRMLES